MAMSGRHVRCSDGAVLMLWSGDERGELMHCGRAAEVLRRAYWEAKRNRGYGRRGHGSNYYTATSSRNTHDVTHSRPPATPKGCAYPPVASMPKAMPYEFIIYMRPLIIWILPLSYTLPYSGLSFKIQLQPQCTFRLGVPKFSSEPRFKPRTVRTEPRFRFSPVQFDLLGRRFWFRFAASGVGSEPGSNRFEPEPYCIFFWSCCGFFKTHFGSVLSF